MIKVGVLGAKGRMGTEVCRAVDGADDMALAAAVDVGDARDALAGVDVVVDFTHPAAVMDNLRWCVEHGRNSVVGTSGFDEQRLAAVRSWLATAPGVRVLVAPNFAIGGSRIGPRRHRDRSRGRPWGGCGRYPRARRTAGRAGGASGGDVRGAW